jgi:CheY-like chemotaxis protein
MRNQVVLIVDDHSSFRRIARNMLEMAGFDVVEAATGSEAVAAARTGVYDLVLLDVQLPDFDGFEVARRLAAMRGRAVVVLTSARPETDYGPRVSASPVNGFVAKPDLSVPVLRSMMAAAQ